MFEEQKTDDISTDVICGNVTIRKLKYGNYKVNKIHVSIYDGHLVTSIQYTITNNIFSLNSYDEIVYLGNIHIKPLIVNQNRYIVKLEFSISDSFSNDIKILKDKNLIKENYILINKYLNIPAILIEDKFFRQ